MNNPAMNTKDMKPLVAQHRGAELDMLLSPEVDAVLKQPRVQLIDYQEVKNPFTEE